MLACNLPIWVFPRTDHAGNTSSFQCMNDEFTPYAILGEYADQILLVIIVEIISNKTKHCKKVQINFDFLGYLFEHIYLFHVLFELLTF